MKQGRTAPDIKLNSHYPSPLAGVLSYLVPGAGQIYQGRVAKGILFLVCLYGLFFYGMYLGKWQNVYMYSPQAQAQGRPAGPAHGAMFGVIADRARFIAQAWIGVAAWPAIIQSVTYNPNVEGGHPWFGEFQRPPTVRQMTTLLQDHDKHPDLGWVYTVIAGVLNILVIYDAYAGPVFVPKKDDKQKKDDKDDNADTEDTQS